MIITVGWRMTVLPSCRTKIILTTTIPIPVTPAGGITPRISLSTSMITGDGTTGDITVFGEILFGAIADGTMADFITLGDGTIGAGTPTGVGVVPMHGIMDGDGTIGAGTPTGDGVAILITVATMVAVITLMESTAITIRDGAITTGIHWPPLRCGADPTWAQLPGPVQLVYAITVVDLTLPVAVWTAETA
jgi:hypothetical protein